MIRDYTPKSDKAEWHLTYACDLSCPGCNRACFLPPQTPNMILEDAREFCRQARELIWSPRIIIIGGEPTLHPEFLDFVAIATDFAPGRVEVWSNGKRPRAKFLLDQVRADGQAKVIEGTIKDASVIHEVYDIFLSPADFGAGREPCGTHASVTDPDCGISVDAAGYSLCCMGGMIDGLLGLGVRTKRLADLWDPDFARNQTRSLCRHCGQHLGIDGRRIAASQVVGGTLLSPTWIAAAERATNGRRRAVSGKSLVPSP